MAVVILIVAVFAVANSDDDKIIINGNFNLVGDSQIDWNDTTQECSVFQNFVSNDGGSYDVLKVTLAFYKDGKLIGTNDTVVTGDSFKDFSVNTTYKTSSKARRIYFRHPYNLGRNIKYLSAKFFSCFCFKNIFINLFYIFF